MHPARPQVESKPIEVLDGTAMPRHKRIAMVVRIVGGLRKAADIAEKSPDTINNWRKPGAVITVDGLARLAAAANVSLDWLAGVEHPVDLQLQHALSHGAGASL